MTSSRKISKATYQICAILITTSLLMFLAHANEDSGQAEISVPTYSQRLQRLEIAEAARDTIFRYCLALDSNNLDKLEAVFAKNIVFTLLPEKQLRGRDATLEFFREVLSRKVDNRKHFIANPMITHSSGDKASARSYFLAVHHNHGELSVAWGTYQFSVHVDDNGASHITELTVDVEVPIAPVRSMTGGI